MKSFACLCVVFAAIMPCSVLPKEPVYLVDTNPRAVAATRFKAISTIGKPISLDAPNLRGNPLNLGTHNIYIHKILTNNPGIALYSYTINQHELIISSTSGGSVIEPGEGSFLYDHGTSVSIKAKPDTGYKVDTWFLDGKDVQTGGTIYTISKIQADHTVHVTFKKLSYTIAPLADVNGSIDPCSPITVNYGDDQQFTAKPNIGYEVDMWYLDSSIAQTGGTTYTISNIQSDHRIYVSFKQIGYVITATAGPNGSINPEYATVHAGDDLELTASSDNGYVVDTWFQNDNDVQIGGTTYTLIDIHANYKIHVTFRKILSYSFGDFDFEDDKQFERIANNNFIDLDHPENTRIHIKREVDLGVMLMQNLRILDLDSPDCGKTVNARAKGSFLGTGVDEILIRFSYLFRTTKPGVELVVYLSDQPWLYEPDDPRREQHCLEVARIPVPLPYRPGSAVRGCFAVFEKIINIDRLNLTKGMWIEMELFESQSGGLLLASNMAGESASSEETSVMIDSWSSAAQCYGICLDINWDNFIDEADFLTVVGGYGSTATDDQACLEGVFSKDGTLEMFDVASWDWAMNSESRLLNFCGVSLVGEHMAMMTANTADFKAVERQSLLTNLPGENLPSNLSDLLIAGKRGAMDAPSKLKDRLYVFDNDGLCGGWLESDSDRCNLRLAQGSEGELYIINSEQGVLRLDDNRVIIPPGEITYANEPRYNSSAMVYIGIQRQGADSFGRPLLDAAFDADYVYVVPAVINPEGGEPYTAAAKLKLLDGANPPYEVVEIYDDPPLPNDNQYRDYLREIELDSAGNLYVLNVHCLNESDILWRYFPDGAFERLDLGRPDSNNYLSAPAGMFASKTTDMLYLTSARDNPENSSSTMIYGFSTKGALTLERTFTIEDMHHVTAITENPQTGSLWVAGFNMYDVPQYPNPTQPAFYYPYLAKIPLGSNNVQLIPLYDPDAHDLALPMSIIWTSAVKCGGADLDQSGDVNFSDFAVLAGYWLDANCASPEWCNSADVDKSYSVNMVDLAILIQNWLETGCIN